MTLTESRAAARGVSAPLTRSSSGSNVRASVGLISPTAAATLFLSGPGCPEAARTLNVTIAGAEVTVGSSTSDRAIDCDNGTYAVGRVGSRTSR